MRNIIQQIATRKFNSRLKVLRNTLDAENGYLNKQVQEELFLLEVQFEDLLNSILQIHSKVNDSEIEQINRSIMTNQEDINLTQKGGEYSRLLNELSHNFQKLSKLLMVTTNLRYSSVSITGSVHNHKCKLPEEIVLLILLKKEISPFINLPKQPHLTLNHSSYDDKKVNLPLNVNSEVNYKFTNKNHFTFREKILFERQITFARNYSV